MLRIKVREEGDVAVLSLGGLITAGRESTELHQTVEKLVNDGTTKIVLNMSEIGYIDRSSPGRGRSSWNLSISL